MTIAYQISPPRSLLAIAFTVTVAVAGLCIAGGFFILASRGGGAWALDRWLGAVAPSLARRYWR